MADGYSVPDTTQSFALLLVEDNPGDARLLEEAFSPVLADGLHTVSSGEGAVDFVNQRGTHANAPRPDLILLDWHLPDMDGEDVLTELNSDPDHAHIPVIVLTGSQSDTEILDAYTRNANACITKSANPDELEETLRALERFWLSTARLPCGSNEG